MQLEKLHIVSSIVESFHSHPDHKINLSGAWGACKTLVALQTARELKRSLLIVTASRVEAETVFDDLATFAGEENTLLFPAWEVLPHDTMSPADDIMAERLNTLEKLEERISAKPGICVVTPIRSLMQYVIPRQQLKENSLLLRWGDHNPLETLITELIRLGYTREAMVEQRGEFSVRGGIIDIFPLSSELPARIEYFDDEIESIRLFEPETQRSVVPIDLLKVSPRSEKASLTVALKTKMLAPLTDYFNEETLLVLDEPLAIQERGRLVADQCLDSPYFMDWDKTANLWGRFLRLSLSQMPFRDQGPQTNFSMRSGPVENFSGHSEEFWEQLRDWDTEQFAIHIFSVNPGEQRRMYGLLHEHGYRPEDTDCSVQVSVGRLRAGFVAHSDKLVFLSEREIFGRHYIRRKRRRFEAGVTITQFDDLRAGDFVVHEVHGIGRYTGLRKFEGRNGDYLSIHYAGGDTVYVPATLLDQLQKYQGGDGAVPRLDKLGGATWTRTKDRVRKRIREMTEELIKLYAAREHLGGYTFSKDTPWQEEFEDAFEYEETPDQARAIKDVKQDMESDRPMDRLLCGDVGYGKTEVALRAAFKAVMDRKQVVMLAPTTVLVQQHYNTFRERFAPYPIQVEVLNRFRSPKESREVIDKLKSGEVDVVIGTHRLLSKDVSFFDLGLVIIDEEQRFGVRHKEKLKQMRTSVDVLTMSATPIPRTLHFSLVGIRDMSLINTAPNDRLPIHTCIEAWDKEIIREAIERELSREGQVYFLHNRVQTIDRVVAFIKQIVPKARVGVGHGQMNKRTLEEVMTAFINRDIDVLVCSTIIASGIDIPNANTILVDRADQFGLSQLYQIRGRVGRYKNRAFAYMLVPGDHALTEDAQQRLKALEDFSSLGSGFRVAMRDLEIRGAGDILGGEQSGNIATVGYETYKDLIAEAVAETTGVSGKRRTLPPLEINADAYIPDKWVQIAPQKITLYRRIASLTSMDDIDELAAELKDRFGPLPKPVRQLFRIMEVRALGAEIGSVAMEAGSQQLVIYFDSGAALAPGVQARLRRIYQNRVSFSWADKPAVTLTPVSAAQVLDEMHHLVHSLHQMLTEEEED